jgi:hypothetical protein
MAVDDLSTEKWLDDRMRREVEGIRHGMRALLITGLVLITIYALAAFLILS